MRDRKTPLELQSPGRPVNPVSQPLSLDGSGTAALVFDEKNHIYKVGGVVYPSVTQVINDVLPGWQADEWYMQRGTAMHHGARLYDEGRLDWSSVSPEIEGRLRAWEKFRKEFPATVRLSEHKIHSKLFRFAGTLDRFFDGAVVADIKSTIAPQVQIQLGAYSILMGELSWKTLRGVAVELRDNATYRALWMTRKEIELAERTFLACLTIHNFKVKEGLQ